MDTKLSLLLYFLIGGAIVSAITYMGSHSKSQLAALSLFYRALV